MKKALIAASLVMCAAPALAADLPSRKGPVVAVAPVAVTWTGFYVGASAGARWTNFDWRTDSLFLPAIPAIASTAQRSLDSATARGAIYGGYNYQFGNVVVGAEADIGYGRNRKKTVGTPGTTFAAAQFGDRMAGEAAADGSLRFRAGYLVTPSILVYGAGGAAFQQSKVSLKCDGLAASWCVAPRANTFSDTRVGWTLGAGVEAQVWGNWLARVEYRYAQFGAKKASFFADAPIDTVAGRSKLSTNTVDLGLAYKF